MLGHFRYTPTIRLIRLIVWVRSFIEPDLFDNNVPFDNTTTIYLTNLLWKLGLDLELHYFGIFH